MNQTSKLFLSFIILVSFLCSAGTHYGKVKTGIYDDVSRGVQYSVYVPENFNSNKKYPLIIALHGGRDIRSEDYVSYWVDEARKRGYVVVCPKSKYEQEKDIQRPFLWEFGYDNDRIIAMLPSLIAKYNIDRKRILLTGMNGLVFYIGINHPELFSALAPIQMTILMKKYPDQSWVDEFDTDSVNYSTISLDKSLQYSNEKEKQIPILMVNGKDSKFISEEDIQMSIDRLKSFGYDARYQMIDSMGDYHDEKANSVILDWFESKIPPKSL